MSLTNQLRRLVRDTAQRNPVTSEWDWEAILNREIYPALKQLYGLCSSISKFPPVRLTGVANALTLEHEHMNVIVTDAAPTALTLSEELTRSFPAGGLVLVTQGGAGSLTVSPQGTVVVRSSTTLGLLTQFSVATLVRCEATTLEWYLFGDLA